MECKFCHAQMEADNTLCPVCGRDNKEAEPAAEAPEEAAPVEATAPETEQTAAPSEEAQAEDTDADAAASNAETAGGEADAAKKASKTQKIQGFIALALMLLCGAFLIWKITGGSVSFDVPTVPTFPSDLGLTEPTLPEATYTAEDSALAQARNQVVAKLGSAELTNGTLQIYYWMEFYNFIDQYGYLAPSFGLDPDQPLAQQASLNPGKTWQQYFLDAALDAWEQAQSLSLEAQAAGFELEPALRAELDSLEANLEAQATANGYASLDEMVQADFGPGARFQDYQNYIEQYYLGYQYFNKLYSEVDPSAEELSAYFDENIGSFTEQGIAKDDTPATIDVRHILISPTGGTKDENGNVTYSDEEWAAAEAQAQEILDTWKQGDMTAESFADLANVHSVDPGSNTNGGLYSDVAPGEMVAEFNDWCFDLSRKEGDTGIVKTKFGYHIMYFVSASEDAYWMTAARTDYLNFKAGEIIEAAKSNYSYSVSMDQILLSDIPQAEQIPETTGETVPETT